MWHCVLTWLSLAQFHEVPAGTAAGVAASLVLAAGPGGLKAFTIMGFPGTMAPGWGAGYWCEALGCG
jgi:hypothetical protein